MVSIKNIRSGWFLINKTAAVIRDAYSLSDFQVVVELSSATHYAELIIHSVTSSGQSGAPSNVFDMADKMVYQFRYCKKGSKCPHEPNVLI
jgi:hypothetical protein